MPYLWFAVCVIGESLAVEAIHFICQLPASDKKNDGVARESVACPEVPCN